ncbi:MAG: hypothetical protein KJ558_14930 [Gammaproteobacteria bacterium]|nr:hypothetical protein [Gammaproteobacteria bacterium]MBU1656082.1 hypothetical protein [Gammaproteobacteria bacterium]MBU1962167.1 hypothetical protein [Gammaproteobacteria bacterium]
MRQILSRPRGFTLVSALFLLVVVSLLGGYMVNMLLAQQSGTALTLQAVRAWYAARAGVEWTLFQVRAGGCPAVPTNFTLDAFSITIDRCTPYPVSEGGGAYNLYDVEVTAASGVAGSPDYVHRRIRATLNGG